MIYINDLISAVMAAAKYSIGGETYFIANDCGCSWETIGRCIGKALGLETVRILKIPYVLVSTLAIFSEGLARLRQRPTLFDRQRALELGQAAWECSNRKLRRELGWQPAFTLPAGLRATADWYRQHGWL